jgi:RNA polymerase sigma factor (TIGR02999 family)
MASEAPGHTLQATALVHEAWLRVDGARAHQWHNRAHFFAAAAEAMRRILIDRARKKMAQRHGGGVGHVDISELPIAAPAEDDKLLKVNEAIEKLDAISPRKAQLVKLRYFAGLTFEEAAEVLGIAVPTAKQWWAYARSWLTVELHE